MTAEPIDAEGQLMTFVFCPSCDHVIDVDGDADGEEVTCPSCHALLKVRRHS